MAVAQLQEPHGEFGTLLRRFRGRAGLTNNELARRAAYDPSYGSRLERNERDPPRRDVVERLARALNLTLAEQDCLLVSAGYAPASVAALGHWSRTLEIVAGVLADQRLSAHEREQFSAVVEAIALRWQRPVIASVERRP